MPAKNIRRIEAALVTAIFGLVVVAIAVAISAPWAKDTPGAPSASPSASQRGAPSSAPTRTDEPTPTPSSTTEAPDAPAPPPPAVPTTRQYPWHTGIVSTTFWVGEIFDPNAADGSQMLSTYDSRWFQSYGGCDGVTRAGSCETEKRTAANNYFPTQMSPLENPFYLDLPFDDINDSNAFLMRDDVVPWAGDAAYRGYSGDRHKSLMKNRWVQLRAHGHTCYGQIQDAGPGEYDDARYVFGAGDHRPANSRYNGAGMDVSPALNGCLRFTSLNGQDDRVDWRFVEAADVPPGPWRIIVTTSGVR